MTAETAKEELEGKINRTGKSLSELLPAEGIRYVLDFYRDVRADGCVGLEEDGDMLLYQWGTYRWEPSFFELNITRQFIVAPGGDPIFQLSLTFYFPRSAQSEAIKDGNRWCHRPDDLASFEAFINESDPYRMFQSLRASKVQLLFENVE